MRRCVIFGLLAALACGAHGAGAQEVWRCGADGRSYSDRPCTGGQALNVDDKRPAADVQAAQQVALREQRLAQTLASERERRARVAPGSGFIPIGPLAADKAAPKRRAAAAAGPLPLDTRAAKQRQPKVARDQAPRDRTPRARAPRDRLSQDPP
jgi:hypothetical protein